MSQRILASIDVTKIDKSKLYIGEKGTYLDIVLIPTPNNKYGDDFLIKQDIRLPEGERGVVIGNAKYPKFEDGNLPSGKVPF